MFQRENGYVRSQFKYKYPLLQVTLLLKIKWSLLLHDNAVTPSDKEVGGPRWPESQLRNRRRNENRPSVTALTFTSEMFNSHDLTLLLIQSTGKCSRNDFSRFRTISSCAGMEGPHESVCVTDTTVWIRMYWPCLGENSGRGHWKSILFDSTNAQRNWFVLFALNLHLPLIVGSKDKIYGQIFQ